MYGDICRFSVLSALLLARFAYDIGATMKVASPKGHNSRARGLQQVDACFDLAGSLGLAVVMTVVVADGVYKGWHLELYSRLRISK